MGIKHFKRAVGFLVAIFVVMMLNYNVYAASEYDNAREISVNTPFTGNTTEGSRYKKNIYKFTLSSDGYVQLKIETPLQGNKDEIWKATLVNGAYEEIFTTTIYGNNSESYSICQGLAAGTYYVSIYSADSWDVKSKDIYTVTVGYKESEYWEKEFNDSFTTATPAEVNKSYSGTIRGGSRYENDYYSFSIPSAGPVTVYFYSEKQDTTDEYWDYTLYNSAYDEVATATRRGNYTSGNMTVQGLPAGTYYLKVCSSDSWDRKSGSIYSFNLQYTKNDYWEKELNNSFTSANNIEIDKTYRGTTNGGSGDRYDYMKFQVSKYGRYRIIYRINQQNHNNKIITLRLYDSVYKEIESEEINGNMPYTNGYVYLSPGTYYLLVEANRYSDYYGDIWQLSVLSPAAETTQTTTSSSASQASKIHIKNYGKYKIKYKITSSKTVALVSVSSGKNNIKKISIPSQVEINKKVYKVTSIGSKAFANCKNLSYVKISANINKIGASAFSGCKKLKTLNVYTTKLKKTTVKGCLKGSNIKVIKTYKSKKKAYAKIFKKSISKSKYNVKVK